MDLTTLAPLLISTLLITISIPLIPTPIPFSAHFIRIESPQAAFYARQIGARNLMTGVILGVFTYHGQLSSAATVLCCFPILGVLDPWIGYMYRGKFVGNDVVHVVTAGGFGVVGWWILGKV